jgi:drug/metabolite transporter (DMT)-like permease
LRAEGDFADGRTRWPPAGQRANTGSASNRGKRRGSSIRSTPPQRSAASAPQTAMLMMTAAVFTIPVIDAMAKWLSAGLSVGSIAWARFAAQTLFLLPFFILSRHSAKRFQPVYLSMGGLIAASILLLFWGLKHLPLANNITLFFVEPLILMLLAGVFLGERITARRWAAVLAGFAGAVIIIRPNWDRYGIASLLPVASAACYAAYLAVTRAVTQRQGAVDAVVLQFWVGAAASGLLGLALVFGWFCDLSILALAVPQGTEGVLCWQAGPLLPRGTF